MVSESIECLLANVILNLIQDPVVIVTLLLTGFRIKSGMTNLSFVKLYFALVD